MAMGKRKSEQAPIWIPATELPVSPGHPFYARLNAILDEAGFDRFAEEQCQAFYAPVMGRPGLPPGRYFRLLLLGYFEGLDSERGIAWRAADSLAIRSFVGLGLDAAAPDHSTISRTRRLIDVETHRAVFTWVQERLGSRREDHEDEGRAHAPRAQSRARRRSGHQRARGGDAARRRRRGHDECGRDRPRGRGTNRGRACRERHVGGPEGDRRRQGL